MGTSKTEISPRQTLAVFIGASIFRRAPRLAQGQAFRKSAEDFRDYVLQSDGLGLPHQNLEWIFDDARSPSEQLEDIGAFLESRCAELKDSGTPAEDLIVYYVGHGLFCGADQHYCLAIRPTAERNEGLTSIRVSDLATVIKDRARFLRKFFILDCCFAASAYRELQSGPLQSQRKKVMDSLPTRGTTLLCSAGSQDASLAPEGLAHTMFSDSLLAALRGGHSSLGPRFSLSELGDLIKDHLREAYPDRWVRPEIHSPEQAEGDIAHIELFPNPAHNKAGARATRPQQPPRASAPHDIPIRGTASPDQQPIFHVNVERSQPNVPQDGAHAPGAHSLLSQEVPAPPKPAVKAMGIRSLYLGKTGRINRKQWWLGFATLLLAAVLAINMLPPELVAILWIWPVTVLTIKRLHDIDKSGWWVLVLVLLPLLPITLLALGSLRGTKGANDFGSPQVLCWRVRHE